MTKVTAAELATEIGKLDPRRNYLDEEGKLNKSGWWLARWLMPYHLEDVREAIEQDKNSARFPSWPGIRKFLAPPREADDRKGVVDSWKHLKLGGLYKQGEMVMYGDEIARVVLNGQPGNIDFIRLHRYHEEIEGNVYHDFPIEDKQMMDRLRPLPEGEDQDEIRADFDRQQEKKELVGAGTAIAQIWKPLLRKMLSRTDPEERKRLRRQRAKETIEEDRLRKGRLSKATRPTVPIVSQAEPAEASVAADTEGSPFSGEEDW